MIKTKSNKNILKNKLSKIKSSKNKSSKNMFWKIYKMLVLFAMVVSVSILVIFWKFLTAYENSQPKYEMENVVELFESSDKVELLKYITYEVSKFENEETIHKFLDNILSEGQWEYENKPGAYTKHTPVYQVKKDGKVVATVTLIKSEKEAEFKTDKWEIKSIDEMITHGDTYSILAPSNSKVYINGVEITSEYIVEKDILINDLVNASKYVTVPTMVRYRVSGLIFDPKITGVGNVYNSELLATNINDHSILFSFESDLNFNNSQESRIIEFTKLYGKYVTNETKFSSISNYLVESSSAYRFLKVVSTTNMWYSIHSPSEFSDMSVKNYQMYSPDCFSCEVSFKLIVKTASKTFEYPTNLKYYFIRSKNAWYIADFVIK